MISKMTALLFVTIFFASAHAENLITCSTNQRANRRSYIYKTVIFKFSEKEGPQDVIVLRTKDGQVENTTDRGLLTNSSTHPESLRFNVTGNRPHEASENDYFLNLPSELSSKNFPAFLEVWINRGESGWLDIDLTCSLSE